MKHGELRYCCMSINDSMNPQILTIKDEFIVALDIGTTKVLCLVADYDEDGELRLVGIGQESCNGLNKGVKSHNPQSFHISFI